MFYTGIDVASLKHDVAIVSDIGEVLVDHLTISNDQAGFLQLKGIIESCCREPGQMKIGMEETGIYHEAIRDFLVALGFAVYTINPILTSYSRKSASPRLTKTDAIDAIAIAKYLMMNIGSLHSYSPSLYYLHDLKALSRIYRDKKDQIAKRKTELKRLIQIAFPEFLTRFNVFSEWSLLLFKDYPDPAQIARIRVSTLVQRIRTKADRLADAKFLHSIAAVSVGTAATSVIFLIRSTIDDIAYFESQIKALLKSIKSIMDRFPALTAIPGIGSITGAAILGEIGDIHRFSSKTALVAFCGIDPTVYQSGNFTAKHAHISKRGSKYLRCAIFNAARAASIGTGPDNKFRQKYLLKIAQGKHHGTAVIAAAKNMLHSIYSILKHDSVYDNLA